MYNVDWIHGRVYGFSEMEWWNGLDWNGMVGVSDL